MVSVLPIFDLVDMAIPGMRLLQGGQFVMGSDRFYPEERPRRRVRVDPFWIDEGPVTNRAFAKFVAATGHVTAAEIAPDPADYPGMPIELAKAGSLLFYPTAGPVDLNDFTQWWAFQFGADWRHPAGPGSNITDLMDHPVVHIAHADAQAYSTWSDKALPTEAEWEFAARGGLVDMEYAWGDQLSPDGRLMANVWQGAFPYQNTLEDGYERTSPVGAFPPNPYGLFDLIGNVWEWTDDWYGVRDPMQRNSCCIPTNPRGVARNESLDPCTPHVPIGRKVLKGGSHLCAPNYCQRYRPAARHPQPIDTSTSHVGFRCVVRVQPEGSKP